ncbi:MAG: DNA-binding response regulator [Acidobacteria bacterium]|nr:MAG: DNA-binding response regulator [Acidobacteriota bacterium]
MEPVDARPRILVLDDDSMSRRLLEASLTAEGMVVETFGTFAHASAAALRQPYDLYLLDIVLPDGDGLDLCKQIRQRSQSPIIVLTVKGDLQDVVKGLELGADDYIVKPFRMPEVVARVRAQLRRTQERSAARETAIRVGDVVIDRDLRDASVRGVAAGLSPREFEILDFLAQSAGRSVSRDVLIDHVWSERDDLSEKILAVYVRRLRIKIERDPDNPEYLHTVRGYGYRLGK